MTMGRQVSASTKEKPRTAGADPRLPQPRSESRRRQRVRLWHDPGYDLKAWM